MEWPDPLAFPAPAEDAPSRSAILCIAFPKPSDDESLDAEVRSDDDQPHSRVQSFEILRITRDDRIVVAAGTGTHV